MMKFVPVFLVFVHFYSAFASQVPVCRLMAEIDYDEGKQRKIEVLKKFLESRTGESYTKECCEKRSYCWPIQLSYAQKDRLLKLSEIYHQASYLFDKKTAVATLIQDPYTVDPKSIVRLFDHIESAWRDGKAPDPFTRTIRKGVQFRVDFSVIDYAEPPRLLLSPGRVDSPNSIYLFEKPMSGGQKTVTENLTWGDWQRVVPISKEKFRHLGDFDVEMGFLSAILDQIPWVLPKTVVEKPFHTPVSLIPFRKYQNNLSHLFNGLDYKEEAAKNFTTSFDVLEQAGSILHQLEEMEISHGDVKLSNFVYSQEGRIEVRIIDFGLAYYAHKPPLRKQGTMGLAAPEEQPVPFKSDVFSLGMMSANILPFGTKSSFVFPDFLMEYLTAASWDTMEGEIQIYAEKNREDLDPFFHPLRQFVFSAIDLDPKTRISLKRYNEGIKLVRKIYPFIKTPVEARETIVELYRSFSSFVPEDEADVKCRTLTAPGNFYIFSKETPDLPETAVGYGLGVCYLDSQKDLYVKMIEVDPKETQAMRAVLSLIKTLFFDEE